VSITALRSFSVFLLRRIILCSDLFPQSESCDDSQQSKAA
jgi:hypothetical protein